MFCKKWSGTLLFLVVAIGSAQRLEKNKPTKPIFPNLVLPSSSKTKQVAPPSSLQQSNQYHPPQFQDDDYDYALPPIPELFRKIKTNKKPSIFQKPKEARKESATPKPEEVQDSPTPADLEETDDEHPPTQPPPERLETEEVDDNQQPTDEQTPEPDALELEDNQQAEQGQTPEPDGQEVEEIQQSTQDPESGRSEQEVEEVRQNEQEVDDIRQPEQEVDGVQEPTQSPESDAQELEDDQEATQAPTAEPLTSEIDDVITTTTDTPRLSSTSNRGKPTSTQKQKEPQPRSEKTRNESRHNKLNFKGLPEPVRRSIKNQPRRQQNVPQQFAPQPIQQTFPERERITPHVSPSIEYRIAVVADLGNDAKLKNGGFKSLLKEGTISVKKSRGNSQKYNIEIEFDDTDPHMIESRLNIDNEGFELSTLNVFNGKLYSCDDETGIIYELKEVPANEEKSDGRALRKRQKPQNEKPQRNTTYLAQPWIILSNQGENSGFRCEWATVKDKHLWIGSTGILVQNPEDENDFDKSRQGVKVVSPSGKIKHLDWADNYAKISDAIGLEYHQGFAVHEGVAWSDILQRWLFIPRRIKRERFDPKVSGRSNGNTAIFTDENFESFNFERFGDVVETAGFTSIKFIPGTDDQLVLALKAGLDKRTNQLMSSLEVFDIYGETVTEGVTIGKGIYAGVEFI